MNVFNLVSNQVNDYLKGKLDAYDTKFTGFFRLVMM